MFYVIRYRVLVTSLLIINENIQYHRLPIINSKGHIRVAILHSIIQNSLRRPQFYFSADSPNCATISFIEMRTYFSFGSILRDLPNSITPQTTLHLLSIPVGLLVLPCSTGAGGPPPPPLLPTPFFLVPDRGTGED